MWHKGESLANEDLTSAPGRLPGYGNSVTPVWSPLQCVLWVAGGKESAIAMQCKSSYHHSRSLGPEQLYPEQAHTPAFGTKLGTGWKSDWSLFNFFDSLWK